MCLLWLWSHSFRLYTILQAFNVQTSKDLHLNGVVGQVLAMTVGNGMLFAGTSVSILFSFLPFYLC